MANTTLTADIIAREAVMILENNCVMANLVHRGYEQEFDKNVNGYKPGATVRIRRPTDFTVRSGATASLQDVVEGRTTVTVDTQEGIDFGFTSEELTLDIGTLSERVIKPAMIQLANSIDANVLGLYDEVPRHVTLPAGGMDSYADFSLAPKLMDNCSIPQEGRCAVLSPDNHWELLGSQTALYIQDAARGAYRMARLGMVGGVDTYMSQNTKTHTHGSRAGTDLINQTLDNTTHTWANLKDATTVSIAIDGMSGATVTVKKGDMFTIANCWDVNPVSKERLGHLKQFVVMEDATATTNAIADLKIWPPAIGSGAQQTVDFGVADLDDDVVTWRGAASTGYRESLFFHKNAFALTMVPMVRPPGAVDVGRRTYKGMSVRVVPYYDGTNDKSNWRLDVLYGVDCIDPRLAVRASLAADLS